MTQTTRRAVLAGAAAAIAVRKARAAFFLHSSGGGAASGGGGGGGGAASGGGGGGGGGGNALPLVRTFNQPSVSSPSTFWYLNQPFQPTEFPVGQALTATLGGTAVRLQGETGGAWGGPKQNAAGTYYQQSYLYVDFTGVTISSAASLQLTTAASSASWSGTSNRTDTEIKNLNLTVTITNLATSGTSASDMNGAGTWTATLDPTSANNTRVAVAAGPVARHITLFAPFFNGATQHRFLYVFCEFIQYQTSAGAAGPVVIRGPFVCNDWAFKTDLSQFNYTLTFLNNGTTVRSEDFSTAGTSTYGHIFSTAAQLCRNDGQWDWLTGIDPQIWVSQDYTKVTATQKIPPFKSGITYAGASDHSPTVTITAISSGTFTYASTQGSLWSEANRLSNIVACAFSAAAMPSGLTAGQTYWAVFQSSTAFTLYNTLGNAIAAGSTGQVSPGSSFSSLVAYNVVAPCSAGQFDQSVGDTGPRPDLSLLSEWAAAYIVGNTQPYQTLGRVMAYLWGSLPATIINAVTLTIPSVLDSSASGTPSAGTNLGGGTGLYGSGQTGGTYTSSLWCWGNSTSANVNGGGSGATFTPTGSLNNWLLNPDHAPNTLYGVWIMEGGEFLRRLLLAAGNAGTGWMYSGAQQWTLSGTTYYGCGMFNTASPNMRRGAWAARGAAQALFAAPQGSAEETYFKNMWLYNVGQFNAYATYANNGGSNYTTMGMISYDDVYPVTTTLNDELGVHGFMVSYMVACTNYAAMLVGDRVSGLGAVAAFAAQWYIGQSQAGLAYYAWLYCACNSRSDISATSPAAYLSAFTEVAWGGNDEVWLDFTANSSSITITGLIAPPWTLAAGDKVRLQNYYDGGSGPQSGTAAPSPFADNTDYFIKTTDGSTTMTLAATSGGTAISCGSTGASNVGVRFMPAGQPSQPTGMEPDSWAQSVSDPNGYLMWLITGIAMAVINGVSGAAAAYSDYNGRYTGGVSSVATCGWLMQDTA
jgi:hypothetical protein